MGALTDRIGSASFFYAKKLYREKINYFHPAYC